MATTTTKLSADEQDKLEEALAKMEGPNGPLWMQNVLQGIVDPPSIRAGRLALRMFVTNDPDTIALKKRAIEMSKFDDPVLILGESGTGKELLANIVHGQRAGLFVGVNVCTVTDTLFESELFGHVKGAFTGADRDRDGLIKQAEGGTLFLDEIGDMPMLVQSKLLRVIQTKRFRKVGGNFDIAMKCRIVAATHRNIPEMVKSKEFRLDLYERLQVFKLRIKPLRDRMCDLELHVPNQLLSDIVEQLGPSVRMLFSGNVRQLLNLRRRWEVFGKEEIEPDDVI